MKLLDKYIFIDFIRSFIMSLFALVFMFEIMTILDGMNIDTKADPVHLQLYYIYSIPQIIYLVFPPALMFGVCFTVAQFTVARELVAVYSAGISFYRGILVLILSGIFATVFVFLFQNFIVTPVNVMAQDEMSIIRKDTGVVKDVIWQKNLRGREGYYFLYYFDRKKLRVLGGFNYLKVNKNRIPEIMYDAKKALYNQNTRDWTLQNVNILAYDEKGFIKERHYEDQKVLKLPEALEFFSNPTIDPQQLNIFQLNNEIKKRESLGMPTLPYRVQFHANISFPLMCFIVVIVGALAGNSGNLRSGGPLIRSILLSTATILIYQITFRLGVSLGNNGVLSPALAGWGPTLVFFSAAAVLVQKNMK